MKNLNFLLTKKWIGAAVFILYCLLYSAYCMVAVNDAVMQYMPTVKVNISDFLPITIENGMITKPENAIIERTYGSDDDKFKVVLDTRTEEFEPSLLQVTGLYISRSALYTVNSNKNEVRINSLRDVPNMVIDDEIMNAVVTAVEGYIKPVIFGFVMFWVIVAGLVTMGLYSLVLHWIMSAIYKAPYRQTLRLTVYSYIVLSLLGNLFTIPHLFILGFIVAAIVNFAVNMAQKQKEAQA